MRGVRGTPYPLGYAGHAPHNGTWNDSVTAGVRQLADERVAVMAIRAEQYRHLAQECQRIAKTLPPGSRSQTSLLEMSEVWERLAKEQERATDVRQQQQ